MNEVFQSKIVAALLEESIAIDESIYADGYHTDVAEGPSWSDDWTDGPKHSDSWADSSEE